MSIVINNSNGEEIAIYDSKTYEYVKEKKGIEYESDIIINNVNVHTVKANDITLKRDYCILEEEKHNWGFSQVDHLVALYYYNTSDGKLHLDAELYSGEAALTKATEYNIRGYCSGHVLGYNVNVDSQTNTTVTIKGLSSKNSLQNTSTQNVGLTLGTASVEKTFMWEEKTDTINVVINTLQNVIRGEKIDSESYSNLNYSVDIAAPKTTDTSLHTYYIVKTSSVTITLDWGSFGGRIVKFLDELI